MARDSEDIRIHADFLSQKTVQNIDKHSQLNNLRTHIFWLPRRSKLTFGLSESAVTQWLRQMTNLQASMGTIAKYEKLRDKRAKDSCDWLFAQASYSAWTDPTRRTRLLWLSAPPGAGKSTLCSRAIQCMLEGGPARPTAYYFYRFDEVSRALDVLVHLGDQLLRSFITTFPSELHLIENLEVFYALERVVVNFGNSSHLRCAKELINLLIHYLPPTFIFLDGVDEEAGPERREGPGSKRYKDGARNTREDRWSEAEEILKFLKEVVDTHSDKAHVWISSQNIPRIASACHDFARLNVTTEMKQDMINYLSSQLDGNVSAEKKDLIIDKQREEPGNWLWADLMISGLKDTTSQAERARFIEKGPTLEGYYSTFFERLEQNTYTLARYARQARYGEVLLSLFI